MLVNETLSFSVSPCSWKKRCLIWWFVQIIDAKMKIFRKQWHYVLSLSIWLKCVPSLEFIGCSIIFSRDASTSNSNNFAYIPRTLHFANFTVQKACRRSKRVEGRRWGMQMNAKKLRFMIIAVSMDLICILYNTIFKVDSISTLCAWTWFIRIWTLMDFFALKFGKVAQSLFQRIDTSPLSFLFFPPFCARPSY